jgi:hypothetical protein
MDIVDEPQVDEQNNRIVKDCMELREFLAAKICRKRHVVVRAQVLELHPY